MAEANPPQEDRLSLSTGSELITENTQSRDNRMSLSTGSDAMMDFTQSRDKRHTISAGSDFMFEFVCEPCNNSGDFNEADGYCKQCSEYLCKSCIASHKIARLTKHHTLLDNATMPRMQTNTSVSYTCTQRCKIHTDEIVKYYCPSHNSTGCNDCMDSKHYTCKNTVYIPNELKNYSSNTFSQFQTLIANLTKKSDKILQSLNENIQGSADDLSNVLHDIEVLRQEFNNAVDNCKATIVDKIEHISAHDKMTMSLAANQTRHTQAVLQRMSTQMKPLLNNPNQQCQLFIAMKDAEPKLADIQQQLEKAETVGVTAFRFNPNEDLQRLIRSKDVLGELCTRNMTTISATRLADITVNVRRDRKSCVITGSTVLSKDTLVIVDWENAALKLIDTDCKRVISEYQPEAKPRDITRVNERQVAVTLPQARTIILMRSVDTLRLDEEIRVDHECWYIAHINDQLVVGSKDPPVVRLLSMTGEVLQAFSTSSKGEPLFSLAPRVTVSPFAPQTIYAIGLMTDRVLMLGMSGDVVARYQDFDLSAPTYCDVDDLGSVYVCGGNSHNVHVLTPCCTKIKLLLTEKDGIRDPLSVSYCRGTWRLYIGSSNNNNVQVYQLQ